MTNDRFYPLLPLGRTVNQLVGWAMPTLQGIYRRLTESFYPLLPLGRTVNQLVLAKANCSSVTFAPVRIAPHKFAPLRLALFR